MNEHNLYDVAEVEITYRHSPNLMQRPKIESTIDAVKIIIEVEDMKKNIDYKELFYSVYLNQSGKVLSVCKVSEGTTINCLINIRQILQSALLQNATGLIVIHNHPSGDCYPSEQDIAMTKRIKDAASLFDIKLLDSIIISSYDYYSIV